MSPSAGAVLQTDVAQQAAVQMAGRLSQLLGLALGHVGVAQVEVLSGLTGGETVIVSSTAEFADAQNVLLTD